MATLQVELVNERGQRLKSGKLWSSSQLLEADADGLIAVALDDGAMAVVARAPGMLDEPLVIGVGDADRLVTIRMLSDAGGKRWTMHAAGDVMFGRRYNQPTQGEPMISRTDAPAGARAVVSSVEDVFGAADVRTFNLETVVSNLPDSAAYPGKRFILNSWPDTLAGVKALRPSLVILANNHARDYLDEGVTETTRALDAEGITHTGATDGTTPVDVPVITKVGKVRLGTLSWTTVDGSFVNDNYPKDEDPMPSDIASSERWQWDKPSWGFDGTTWTVPDAPHRIGTVWSLFEKVESSLSENEKAQAWRSMVAVYPSLQDWVARRGHGGAAPWNSLTSPAAIEALKEEADVVAVQLHAGYQFQPAPSDNVAAIARDAIDAGADLVICHHPHVLQGAEWYKDKLIIFSLGNFVFDQDFFATFSTAFVRTVWEGTQLIEARFIPLELAGYRPTPVADGPATRTLLRLWEMSIAGTRATRLSDGVRVVARALEPEALPAHLRIEHNTAVIVRASPVDERLARSLPPKSVASVNFAGLVDPRLGLAPGSDNDIEIGRDLLGWGDFEDLLADHGDSHFAQWAVPTATSYKHVIEGDDAPSGRAYLHLSRTVKNGSDVIVRPVARTPIVLHRLFETVGDTTAPLDPEPSYSVRMLARRSGAGHPFVRLDLYMFDDTNPTEDPSSTLVGSARVPLEVPDDDDFHDLEVELAPELLVANGVRANMLMFYVGLEPPASAASELDVDQVQLVEWRNASKMPAGFGSYDLIRNRGKQPKTLSLTGLPASHL